MSICKKTSQRDTDDSFKAIFFHQQEIVRVSLYVHLFFESKYKWSRKVCKWFVNLYNLQVQCPFESFLIT